MKLAISNIAWAPGDDDRAAELLARHGVAGVELAPTAIWPRPAEVDAAAVRECRTRWADRGIDVVALQALLYGRPELTLFEDSGMRRATLDYLVRIIRLGSKIGAGVLVFGSPGNRRRNGLGVTEALDIAVGFFAELGRHAADLGVCLCIEPNPPYYGCDFVTTAAEGAELVRAVGSSGFGLHLDAAAMTLGGDEPARALPEALPLTRHFHISEPDLAPPGAGGVDHAAFAAGLADAGYRGWVSVEMRQGASAAVSLDNVDRALALARSVYGAVGAGAGTDQV